MSFFAPKPKVLQTLEEYSIPISENPIISAFYAQVTEHERIAHAIALVKLGTSYDVTRTHGFIKWKKNNNNG